MHPLPHPADAGEGTRVPNPRPGASSRPTATTCKPAVSWKQALGAIGGRVSVSRAPQTQQLLPAANTLLSATCGTTAQPAGGQGWQPAAGSTTGGTCQPRVSSGSADSHLSNTDSGFPSSQLEDPAQGPMGRGPQLHAGDRGNGAK